MSEQDKPIRKTWIMLKKANSLIPYEKPTGFYISGNLGTYDAFYNTNGGHLKTDQWIDCSKENGLILNTNINNWDLDGYNFKGDTTFDFSSIGKDRWSLSIELGLKLNENSSGCICEIANYRGEVVGFNVVGTKVYSYRNTTTDSTFVTNPRYLRLGYASYKNTNGTNMRCSRQRADAGISFGNNGLFSPNTISTPKTVTVGSKCNGENKANNIKIQYIKLSGSEWNIWNDYDYAICKQNYNAIINRYGA